MTMIMLSVLAVGASLAVPGYVLGQPIEEARNVVPNGKSAESWHLRCAGDAHSPAELKVTAAEKRAGVQRCWTIEIVDGREQRAAYPRGPAVSSSQEIEFIDGRIVRITKVYRYENRVPDQRIVLSLPEAARIDRLADGSRN